MLKGAQKNMVVVKTADSVLFEEAYFVMRREAYAEKIDLLAEANRIIEGCTDSREKRRKLKYKYYAIAATSFLTGTALGAGIVAFISAVM